MSIQEQYDTYPYPARNPKDERKRLVRGSPSHPVEMDHYLWGGKRNWREPIRILVAGGGTGDALVQLAQVLTTAKRAYEITYLDLSTTAREIAEARIAERKLQNVTFHTASLLDAPDYGQFDYIDCCGVLHHLPEPDLGFQALSKALSPEGGLGMMVYAPYGRSGVYALQEAFGALSRGMTAKERLKLGKSGLRNVPDAHPFKRNQVLVDHKKSDAGFYDLLLHSQDRPYSVGQLAEALSGAGMKPASFLPAAQYDLQSLLPEGAEVPEGMDWIEAMDVAEKLRGTIKTHIVYAVPEGREVPEVDVSDPWAVPHLKSLAGPQLAGLVAKKGRIVLDFQTESATLKIPKEAAPILTAIDGQTPLKMIRERVGMDEIAFASLWRQVHEALVPWNELNYSKLYRP